MSSPYSTHDASYHDGSAAAFQSFEGADEANSDIPRRVMRVKVLYTFDNDNKTHCLARLVRPVPIQVVALDETTEIGVVELRTCIQAIVAASPEMIAKLENDYTVYAYDYSEYETPLVGQGMLSWVLATASLTPNAPARESGTMVTGRVCRNIMGLFASGGIKETLEVKLKLVPVPTRSKREYLQSMAVYRDPNVVVPDGFDNNAWNSFLQAIPDAGVLRDGSAGQQAGGRANVGSVEQLHDLLTPKYGQEDDLYSNGPGSSRPASPTPSQRSMTNHPAAYHGSRPASRASFHQPQLSESAIDDQSFEDGPAKKRARLMQADWHGRGSFGGNAESLRSAVTTAASIRNFRPSAIGNSSAGGDMVPRAPTPRPGEKRMGRPGMPRAGSSLRRESTGGMSTYSMPELDLTRNDSGIYSADYDAGSSRHGSPSPDLPSSPPEFMPIEPPSSPLPELPAVPDSGFQSDLPTAPEPSAKPSTTGRKVVKNAHLARKAKGIFEWSQVQPGPRESLPTNSFPHFDPLSHKSAMAAQTNRLPTSPSIGPANRKGGGRAMSRQPTLSRQPSTTPLPVDEPSPSMHNPVPSIENSFPPTPNEGQEYMLPPPVFNPNQRPPPPQQNWRQPAQTPSQPRAETWAQSSVPPVPASSVQPTAHHPGPTSMTFSLEPRQTEAGKKPAGQKPAKAPRRALKKAQSWAAAESSDIDSDGGLSQVAIANKRARSKAGSGAIRSASIYNQLESSIASGLPPRFCCNCGEIKTPTWRPYWLKVEEGSGENITIGATGIHMVEPVETDAEGKITKYRIYKQYGHLTPDERNSGTYQQMYFCNPCGDYIRKYAGIRPREMWDPVMKKEMQKKRGPRKKKGALGDTLTSDAPVPSSEWDLPTPFAEVPMFTDPFGPSEAGYEGLQSDMGQIVEQPLLEQQHGDLPETQRQESATTQQIPLNDDADFNRFKSSAEFTALQKAIQSSPARILAPAPTPPQQQQPNTEAAESQTTNEVITPRPTRRLLFPSPRKDGEFKSLEPALSSAKDDTNGAEGANSSNSTAASSSRKDKAQTPQHTTHHAQRHPASTSTSQAQQRSATSESSSATEATMELEVDKENLPPAVSDEDEFAHLFEEGIFMTPGKPSTSLTKTPSKAIPRTPNSRNALSTGLTPRTGSKRNAECMGPPSTPTPTKRRSPRLAQQNQQKEMTPFTKSLNQFLSDGLTSSPSKVFNWTLTSSPAKNLSSTFGDMAAISRLTAKAHASAPPPSDDNLWSDFPLPSSPPFFSQTGPGARKGLEGGFEEYDWAGLDMNMNLGMGLGVDVWEDGTATEAVGVEWDGVFSAEVEGREEGGGVVPPAE